MTMTSTAPAQHAKLLQNRLPQSLQAQFVIKVANTLLTWDLRRQTRRTLRDMTDSQLMDVGLTRDEANTEARRLFWQG